MPKKQVKKQEKKEIEVAVDFLKNYVAPHTKKSREVKESDLEVLVRDAHILFNLCYTQTGIYRGGYAVAHPQINDKDPLRFFVTADEKVIINPVITNHTKALVDGKEGCLSFPMMREINVPRWNKCEVEYQTIELDDKGKVKLTGKIKESLTGKMSKIFQHEIQHFDGKFIFNINPIKDEAKI